MSPFTSSGEFTMIFLIVVALPAKSMSNRSSPIEEEEANTLKLVSVRIETEWHLLRRYDYVSLSS